MAWQRNVTTELNVTLGVLWFCKFDSYFQYCKHEFNFKNISWKKICQNVYIDNSKVNDFRTLVTVIRQKISYLNFITDTDLRIEYEDDEGTFVRLDDTDPDAFFDAQRCAKVVQGTDSRRLKLRVSESSTPQRKIQKLSYSPDAMCTRSVSEKNVSFNDATSSNPGASSSTTSSSFSHPARKYLNFEARATSSSTNYSSPLERYLKDAVKYRYHNKPDMNHVEPDISYLAFDL